MRVLLANSERGFRGGELQTKALAVGLSERGFEVCVAVPADSALGRELVGRVSVRTMPFERVPLVTPFLLRRLVRAFEPDLIHAQTSRAHTHLRLAGGLLHRAPPLVVSRRVAFSTSGGLVGRLKYRKGVAHYLPISRAAAESLRCAGVPDEKMTVVASGVDVESFRMARGDPGLRETWRIGRGRSIIGTVAALEWEKGLDILVEAASIVTERRSDCTFIIMGEGSEQGRLGAMIERAGLGERVRVVPPPANLAHALPLLDLFVLPSREEGLSTALLAALAAGRAVIASRTGGIPEVIDEGSGLLVPPGDAERLAEAIDRLLEDDDRRAEMGLAGQRRAELFDMEKTIERTIAVYRLVVDRHGASTTLASPGE